MKVGPAGSELPRASKRSYPAVMALIGVVVAGVVLAGCPRIRLTEHAKLPQRAVTTTSSPQRADAERVPPTNPVPWYVDPKGPAAQQLKEYERQGRRSEADAMRRIADQPAGIWLSGGQDVGRLARDLVGRASAARQVPIVVLYNLPHRDCGGFSSGGAQDQARYGAWIADVAAGVGDKPVLVILEPDSIPQVINGCVGSAEADDRYRMLSDAVRTLKMHENTRVYIDAGNSAWIENPEREVGPLRRAGVMNADGFALNVSNFQTTGASIGYGERISTALGGVHFVIDTSRNGRGPLPFTGPGPSWCNPPGRALGNPPTAGTGREHVDAYLWVKQPGSSDGSCRPGEPPAGDWWADYALALAGS